jgi:hypothetical protein
MRRIVPLLIAAAAFAGCGNTTSGTFHGDAANVSHVITDLASAGRSHDTAKICDQLFAPEVSAKLKASGGDCRKVVGEQLDNVDRFEIAVQTVTVNGDRAQARVKSTSNGKDHLDTLNLVRAGGSWRITSLG